MAGGACTECHDAKVKCDKVFPCGRCRRLDKECVLHVSRQGKGRKRRRKKEAVQEGDDLYDLDDNGERVSSSGDEVEAYVRRGAGTPTRTPEPRAADAVETAARADHSHQCPPRVRPSPSIPIPSVVDTPQQQQKQRKRRQPQPQPQLQPQSQSQSQPQPQPQSQSLKNLLTSCLLAHHSGLPDGAPVAVAVLDRGRSQSEDSAGSHDARAAAGNAEAPAHRATDVVAKAAGTSDKGEEGSEGEGKETADRLARCIAHKWSGAGGLPCSSLRPDHYGLRWFIRSWISMAFRRRSFGLLGRAGALAARCGISMDQVLCGEESALGGLAEVVHAAVGGHGKNGKSEDDGDVRSGDGVGFGSGSGNADFSSSPSSALSFNNNNCPMDFLVPILLAPNRIQRTLWSVSLDRRRLRWSELPEDMVAAVGCATCHGSQRHRDQQSFQISGRGSAGALGGSAAVGFHGYGSLEGGRFVQGLTGDEDLGFLRDRWIWVRDMDRGMSRYLVSPSFERDIATWEDIQATWDANEREVTSMFVPNHEMGSYVRTLMHQISLHAVPGSRAKCSRHQGKIRLLTGLEVDVDVVSCLAITSLDRAFMYIEYRRRNVSRSSSCSSLASFPGGGGSASASASGNGRGGFAAISNHASGAYVNANVDPNVAGILPQQQVSIMSILSTGMIGGGGGGGGGTSLSLSAPAVAAAGRSGMVNPAATAAGAMGRGGSMGAHGFGVMSGGSGLSLHTQLNMPPNGQTSAPGSEVSGGHGPTHHIGGGLGSLVGGGGGGGGGTGIAGMGSVGIGGMGIGMGIGGTHWGGGDAGGIGGGGGGGGGLSDGNDVNLNDMTWLERLDELPKTGELDDLLDILTGRL